LAGICLVSSFTNVFVFIEIVIEIVCVNQNVKNMI
jgi:hypothetical protein